jgi:hypothetical protein
MEIKTKIWDEEKADQDTLTGASELIWGEFSTSHELKVDLSPAPFSGCTCLHTYLPTCNIHQSGISINIDF